MQLSQGTETAESTEHIFMFVVFSQSRNAFTDPVITSYRQVCAPRAIEYCISSISSSQIFHGLVLMPDVKLKKVHFF